MRVFVLAVFCIVGVFCEANSAVAKEEHFEATDGPRLSFDQSADPLLGVLTAMTSEDHEFIPQIPDAPVVDQDGHAHRFYTDLIKGKTVAIEFIFTRCTTICPPLGATFAKLQRSFGSEMGKTVFLISVSVDPSNDTPERLREWGKQFHAGPGWTLITGTPNEMRRIQQSFGTDTASPLDHSPIVIIGNDKKSVWKKVYGLGSASALIKTIQEVEM
jgi:cytochrome oxidase Cu insertion factor (SCO1/SenC/PrrC family)